MSSLSIDTSALHSMVPRLPVEPVGGSVDDRFESMLGRMQEQSSTESARRMEIFREAACDLVSSAFVMPVLASIREQSQAAEPFKPGIAQKRLGPVLDQYLSDKIVRGGNMDLVDTIARKFEQSLGSRQE
ncbi:MAG: hypothetical protein CMJ32_08690 [Phycisphaerae bacterium]|nr:hypothetical protein [Phycisphaerae bacterium]